MSEARIRAAFVNLSKGAAQRVNLPVDLDERPWDDLDYLGWRDPKAPTRAYLVVPRSGKPCGIALRVSDTAIGRTRKAMCDLCLTVGAVELMVAPRAGRKGQQGDSVGTYICSDLDCSAFVRNRRSNGTVVMEERLSVEEKIDRLLANVDTFVARVLR